MDEAEQDDTKPAETGTFYVRVRGMVMVRGIDWEFEFYES